MSYKENIPPNPQFQKDTVNTNNKSQDPLKLDDLVYSYPTIYDQDIQRIFGSKKEFNELSAPTQQTKVNRGEFLKHQILTQRMLNVIDELLIMSRTGVGKTGAVVAAAQHYKKAVYSSIVNYAEAHADPETNQNLPPEESYKELLEKNILDHAVSYTEGKNLSITKVYFLVKNKFLVDEMSREITEVLTLEEEYHTEHVKRAPTKHTKDLRLKHELGKFYKIMTYIDFVKEVMNIKPSDRLEYDIQKINENDVKRRFSGCMFIVDEVDSLRSEGEDLDMEKEEKLSDEDRPEKKDTYRSLKFAYDVIHRVFHIVERAKKVIMSATPMSDRPYEIADIMNLILPLNQQMNFSDEEYNSLTQDELEPYFRGRISYVREPDGQVDLIYNGSLMNKKIKGHNSQTKTMRLPMSTFYGSYTFPDGYTLPLLGQDNAYSQAEVKLPEDRNVRISKKTGKVKKVNPNAFKIKLRENAIFSFPDGSGSKYGFNKYISKKSSNDYEAINGLDKLLSIQDRTTFLSYLNVLSSKFAYIFDEVEKSFGTSYVFSPLVKIGSIPLSLVFKYQGYQNFLEKTSIFEYDANTGQYKTDLSGKRIIRSDFVPNMKRFAFITKETPKELRRSILEAFNSPENLFGDIIKVVIISPVGKTGISLKNVSHIFLLSLWWNETFKYQAMSRAVRVMGHTDMLNYLQHYYQSKDPQRFSVNVHFLESVRANEGDTIDSQLYVTSEEKDREIKRIERIMRKCTLDCHIHRKLNQRLDDFGRSTDVDGSQICDYESCTYECSTTRPEEIDYTSYDVIYSGEIIEQIIDIIRELFQRNSIYALDKFYNLFKMPDGKMQYARKHITAAISEIIYDRVLLKDGAGFSHYLYSDGEFLYLHDEYPTLKKSSNDIFSMAIYDEGFYGKREVNIEKEIVELQKPVQDRIISDILSGRNNEEQVRNLLSELNTNSLSGLIEKVIVDKITRPYPIEGGSNLSVMEEWLLGLYSSNIWDFENVIGDIENMILDVKNQNIMFTGGTPVNISMLPNIVLVHDILNPKHQTEHGISKRVMKASEKLRVLRVYPGRMANVRDWKDADNDELLIFNNEITGSKKTTKELTRENLPLYGVFRQNAGKNGESKFYLAGKFRQIKQASHKKEMKDERECKHMHKTELIALLSYLKIYPTKHYTETNNISTERLIELVQNFVYDRRFQPKKRKNAPNFEETLEFFDKEPVKSREVADLYYKWMMSADYDGKPRTETVVQMCDLIYGVLEQHNMIVVR